MEESRRKILIVDDEPTVRDSLKLLLKSNFEVSLAADGDEALACFDEAQPDLVLLDVMMPKVDGIEVLKKLRERGSTTPVIMLTASNTVRTAVQAMKCGARDFLNKPFDVEELTSLIISTLAVGPVETDAAPGPKRGAATRPPADFGPMVGQSAVMTDLFTRIDQIAVRDTTVLITGESGTGKELVARQIHERSSRKNGPFVAINCAAIPESLIESELFGHEKGAFTHAVERRLGHFELANGGTLFLDEIGELSLAVQVKMLRFLQEQEFYRVGRSKPITVDVRIVTATNRSLEDLVKTKQFRQDLFYRINVINLCLPALRERYEDIPRLVDHFAARLKSTYGERPFGLTPQAMEHLVSYEWPGNVRELENVVESLLALCPKNEIDVEDLPRKIRERTVVPDGMIPPVFASGMGFDEAEKLFETEMILKALKRANFVQTRAAELLGISRRILKYKMDKLRINEKGEVASGASSRTEAAESN